MPKLILDLQQKILFAAKKQLLNNGYKGFGLREIAQDCNIAVGTVYNYYQSKEILIAKVILADWIIYRDKMSKDTTSCKDINSGLTCIYNGLIEFSNIYKSVWNSYSFSSSTQKVYEDRHKMLIDQLVKMIIPLFERFGVFEENYVHKFIAENILSSSSMNDGEWENILKIFSKIINKEK